MSTTPISIPLESDIARLGEGGYMIRTLDLFAIAVLDDSSLAADPELPIAGI